MKMEKVKNYFKMLVGTGRILFIILGLVIGFATMLTEVESEFNWVFAVLSSAIICSILEGMHAVMKTEKYYNWRNPVAGVVTAFVVAMLFLLL